MPSQIYEVFDLFNFANEAKSARANMTEYLNEWGVSHYVTAAFAPYPREDMCIHSRKEDGQKTFRMQRLYFWI